MKIFHIITGLKIGGAESVLYNFLANQSAQDEHYVAYFHSGHNVYNIQQLGIPTFQIRGLLYRYDPVAYFRLRKIIKNVNPDLIHSSLWAANIFGRLISHCLKIPIVCDVHGNPLHEGFFRNWLDRKTAFIPAKIIAVSDSIKQSYVKMVAGAIKDPKNEKALLSRIIVIKNGIDSSGLRQKALSQKLDRSLLGLGENDFVIGAVGRLEPIKSYDILIKAFIELMSAHPYDKNNMKLCIIGDGSERINLENIVHKFGIANNVIFTGMRSDPYRFYPIFDCFALSSQSEGLSMALLEALSFGIPVVTTHKSMVHDVITHGVNGFLVPVNNIKLFAEALEKLYLNISLRNKMRIDNISLINTSFSL
jgi:glycosyltransferase involved in cell wall biosynthesis